MNNSNWLIRYLFHFCLYQPPCGISRHLLRAAHILIYYIYIKILSQRQKAISELISDPHVMPRQWILTRL